VVSLGNIPTQYLGESVVFNLQQDLFLVQVLVVSLGLFKDRRVSNKIVFIILIFVIYYYLDKKI
jgi:Flp pilus assembly protein protease CpaA